MAKTRSLVQPLADVLPLLVGRLAKTERAGQLANSPPVAWALRNASSVILRLASEQHEPSSARAEHASGATLQEALDSLVRDVVDNLGYLGAMVATYEKGDELSIRAICVDSRITTMERIREWEQQVSQLTPDGPVSLTDPRVARVNIYDESYAQNLSVLATRSGRPVVRDDLYSLFTPVAPISTKPIIDGIQKALGIGQVIAVPFFMRTSQEAEAEPELVGNLFAIKANHINENDIRILTAFGRRAAETILNEHLKSQIGYVQELVYEMQKRLQNEEQILQMIAEGVVEKLGYVCAMVATYEATGALPLRAIHVDPSVATVEHLRAWEEQISQLNPQSHLRLDDPRIARVYINSEKDQGNLSVRAARSGEPQMSDDIFALLAPVVPSVAKPLVDAIQQRIGIHQIIAVPFFLDPFPGQAGERTLVGNLFALTRSRRFARSEIELLQLFGQQAAVGLRNAQLYRRSEHRRQTAEIFGKMAFSAAASIHALRNHVGGAKTTLQLLQMFEQADSAAPLSETEQLRRETFEQIPAAIGRLNQAAGLLDTLHEPWRQIQNMPTDVNTCLVRALSRVLEEQQDWVQLALEPSLPTIDTVPDMLIEAFKVLIKNAVEAIETRHTAAKAWPDHTNPPPVEPRSLQISSQIGCDGKILVTIRDNGIGVPPEHLNDIFEMGWTTKESGLGFGLFWTKDYMEGLGGDIQIESVWQQGTQFHISLPSSGGSAADALPETLGALDMPQQSIA